MNQGRVLSLSQDVWRCPDYSLEKEIYGLNNERKRKSQLKWIMGHSYSVQPSSRKTLNLRRKEAVDILFITAIHSTLTCVSQAAAFKIMLHFLYFASSWIILRWRFQNKTVLYQSEATQLCHSRLGQHHQNEILTYSWRSTGCSFFPVRNNSSLLYKQVVKMFKYPINTNSLSHVELVSN